MVMRGSGFQAGVGVNMVSGRGHGSIMVCAWQGHKGRNGDLEDRVDQRFGGKTELIY